MIFRDFVRDISQRQMTEITLNKEVEGMQKEAVMA
jgi:hypothetical protein